MCPHPRVLGCTACCHLQKASTHSGFVHKCFDVTGWNRWEEILWILSVLKPQICSCSEVAELLSQQIPMKSLAPGMGKKKDKAINWKTKQNLLYRISRPPCEPALLHPALTRSWEPSCSWNQNNYSPESTGVGTNELTSGVPFILIFFAGPTALLAQLIPSPPCCAGPAKSILLGHKQRLLTNTCNLNHGENMGFGAVCQCSHGISTFLLWELIYGLSDWIF